MSHWRPLVGALAVIALLLIAPVLGLIALGACVVGGLIFWMSDGARRRDRPCPRCGEGVENGVLDCPHCGFDFRTIGAS
jgi:PHP family Zn ribbon phosphoesterase